MKELMLWHQSEPFIYCLSQEFNAGLFDYLIATDDSQSAEEQNDKESQASRKKSKKHPKRKMDAEFGVVRGIDFKNVYTVSWHVFNLYMLIELIVYVCHSGGSFHSNVLYPLL